MHHHSGHVHVQFQFHIFCVDWMPACILKLDLQGIVFVVDLTIDAKNGNPHAVLSYVGDGHLRIGRSKDRISDSGGRPSPSFGNILKVAGIRR